MCIREKYFPSTGSLSRCVKCEGLIHEETRAYLGWIPHRVGGPKHLHDLLLPSPGLEGTWITCGTAGTQTLKQAPM